MGRREELQHVALLQHVAWSQDATEDGINITALAMTMCETHDQVDNLAYHELTIAYDLLKQAKAVIDHVRLVLDVR